MDWMTTDVWYCPEWKVWMVTAYTADGDQVGESECYYTKAEAEHTARGYFESDRCELLLIHTKTGKQNRIERSAA